MLLLHMGRAKPLCVARRGTRASLCPHGLLDFLLVALTLPPKIHVVATGVMGMAFLLCVHQGMKGLHWRRIEYVFASREVFDCPLYLYADVVVFLSNHVFCL